MRTTSLFLAASLLVISAAPLASHCQVPCGIYDDAARIAQIRENITTIEKATRNIEELAGKSDAQSLNQAARWIAVKEQHASDIIEIVSTYFLTQKLKAPETRRGLRDYHHTLADHHAVMRAAMKTKQTVSMDAVEELKRTVDKLDDHWVDEDHQHAESSSQTKPRR